jgi:hypothetical protein
MKDDIITVENNGIIVNRTNYYDTAQAKRGEVYLTWNAGCGRLLIPARQRQLIASMKCDHVVVTKKRHGIDILFDDLSDRPFMLVIAHEQNDRPIQAGDCLFSVYVKMGEKYQLPCKCRIDHGNVGNDNASKGFDGHLNIRCRKSDKARWVRQHQKEGLNLTDWVHKTLNNASDN